MQHIRQVLCSVGLGRGQMGLMKNLYNNKSFVPAHHVIGNEYHHSWFLYKKKLFEFKNILDR